VPKATTPGKVLRVREKGWPNYDTQIRGSLLCKINASFPELNDTQIEYIKKINDSKG
jgi:DnaJ-class molecular chaperone